MTQVCQDAGIIRDGTASASDSSLPRRTTALVRHYGPGGREHGGGIGRFIGYVTDAAAERGHRHEVTDTRGSRLSPLSLLRFCGALARMTGDRVTSPGMIHHIHLAGRGSTLRKLVLARYAGLLGCGYVIHLHDFDYAADLDRRSLGLRSSISRMFRRSEAVIVLGEADRRLAIARLGVLPSRVVVLHNFVPDPGERHCRSGEVPEILFLGGLSDRKGVPELLEALALMSALPWRAVLAGDGPIRRFESRAAELGLAARVKMPGWLPQDQVSQLCRSADILVLPSHAEGMAMAVLEGMAHGAAVVTTPVGAHDEVISDSQNGLFVPPGDVTALAQALSRLIVDPVLRDRIGAAGRQRYLSGFSAASQVTRLETVYSTIAARRAARKVPEGKRG